MSDRQHTTRVDLTPAQMARLERYGWKPGSGNLGEWLVVQLEYSERHAEEAEAEFEEAEAEFEEAEAEAERLRRILAVEQGDESQAPEGWRHESRRDPWDGTPIRRWVRSEDVVWWGPAAADYPAWWSWFCGPVERPTALEAMEAADAAREKP